jgi:hypothetical protein
VTGRLLGENKLPERQRVILTADADPSAGESRFLFVVEDALVMKDARREYPRL